MKTWKLPGRRKCRYCMISSIMPVCKHPLCLNTGKRIRKVDRVLLRVCAKLSTWMVAQGTSADCSPFRQKSSQNSSSCVYEVGLNLQHRRKEVPQGSCTPKDTFRSNYFFIISGWKLHLPISTERGFSLTRLTRFGRGCEQGKCVSKNISKLYLP